MRGTFEEPPTGLIHWFSKLREILTLNFAASPSPLRGKPTLAQDIARRISGAVVGEVYAKVNISSTHHIPLSPTLHYLTFASRFPLPHFTLAILFALSLYPPSLFPVCRFLPLEPSAVMSEIGEIIVDMDNNNMMENSDAPAKEPLPCI